MIYYFEIKKLVSALDIAAYLKESYDLYKSIKVTYKCRLFFLLLFTFENYKGLNLAWFGG